MNILFNYLGKGLQYFLTLTLLLSLSYAHAQCPTADAGGNQAMCESEGNFDIDGTATNYISIAWTSSGTGSFINGDTEDPTYVPSAVDVQNGGVTLTMTVTQDNHLCPGGPNPVQNSMILRIKELPTVNAGVDQTICETDHADLTGAVTSSSAVLWTSSGDGNFNDNASEITSYFPGAGDIAAGIVQLTLTATGEDDCATETVSDIVTINIRSNPTISAGTDATICENQSYTVSTATGSDYLAINWTTSGSGSFINGNTLNPTYTPSPSDLISGVVSLTVNATAQSPCSNSVSDVMVLTMNELPTANAGNDESMCSTDANINLNGSASNYSSVVWTTGGSGTFTNPGTLNAVYTPGAADIANGSVVLTLTSTGTGSCSGETASDNLTVTIVGAPEVNAGADDEVCNGSAYTLAATADHYTSLLWTSDGDGSFSNSSSLTATYTPGANDIASGSVNLTLTASPTAPCASDVVDAMVLTIVADPIVNAGNDITSCGISPVSLVDATNANTSSVLWSTSGTGSFSDVSDINAIYTPSVADVNSGNIVLTITGNAILPCTVNSSDNLLLSLTQEPIANAGSDGAVCEGESYTVFDANAEYETNILWTSNGDGSLINADTETPNYTPGAVDIANGTVTLTMTVTGNAPCNVPVSDQMVITIDPLATANAGGNDEICGNDSFTTAGVASDYSSVLWTSTGTGLFGNDADLITTYTPSAADITAGSVQLTLTVVGNGACTIPVTSSMILTIIGEPGAEAGPNATICGTDYLLSGASATNPGSISWSTSGDGNFVDNTMENPVYSPGNNDIASGTVILTMTVNANAPCVGSAVDNVVLTVVAEASVFAGADDEICETQATYIMNGATGNGATAYTWSTSGTGSFIDNSIINATYVPSASDIENGGVTLSIAGTNSPCPVTASSMFLTIYEEPEVEAGDNATVCDNSTYSLVTANADHYSNLLWTTSGSGSFDNASLESPTYLPSAGDYLAGSVTLTLTASPQSPCAGSVSDFMILSFEDEPSTVEAGAGGHICENESFTITDATAANYDNVNWSGGDGTWSGQNSLVPTYTPGPVDIVHGTVTLTLTVNPNSPCTSSVVDNTTLLIQSLPTVEAGDEEAICQGETVELATASASDYSSLLWTTTGTGTFDDATIATPIYTPSAADISAGGVTLQLTATSIAPCGGTEDDSMVLTINQDPIADAGSDATICADASYFIFDASATNFATTVWTTSGDGSFNNSTIIDPVYTPGPNDIINGTATLTLTTTGTTPCLGSDNDQMIITIDPIPVVEAGNDSDICEGDYFTTTTASVANYSSIQWTTDGTGAFTNSGQIVTSYTPSAQDINNGTVTLTLTALPTGTCTAPVSDQVVVTIIAPPSVDAGPDHSVCEAGITIITATADNFSTVNWTTSGSSGTLTDANTLYPTYTPSPDDIAAGSVTLTVTVDPNAPCVGSVSDDLVITISSDPVVNAGVDATICETDTYHILTSSVTDYSALNWSTSGDGTFINNGTLHPTYTPGPNDIANGSATLTLTADAVLPCTSTPSDEMILTIQPLASVEAGSDVTVCNGDTHTTVDAFVSDYTSLIWSSTGSGSFDDNSVLHTVYTPSASDIANGFVVLTLTAENENPCTLTESDFITITYQDEPTADAGTGGTICETDSFTVSDAAATVYSSILWTTSGNGSFTNETTLTPTYVPGDADAAAGSVILTMTVEAIAPCTVPATDQITLIVDPMPTMNAGDDDSVCQGSTYTVTTASASDFDSFTWTSSGTGVFTNGNTLSPTYTPSAEDVALGSVILRLTGTAITPCSGSEFDEMTLTVVSLAEADAGNDEIVCETDLVNITSATAANYSSLLWNTSGSGVFSDAAALNPEYTLSDDDIAAGSVVLSLTAYGIDPCTYNAVDNMTVSVDLAPVSFAGDDATICEDASYTINDATAENYTSVSWTSTGTGTLTDANTLTPTYIPSNDDITAGSVILSLTSSGAATCADSTDQMVLSFSLNPVVDAGADAVSCEDGNYQIVGVNVTDYNTLTWTSSGTGVFSNPNILMPEYVPSAADLAGSSVVLTLTATANSPCLNSDSDSFTLTFQETATANAGSDELICQGENITINSAAATNYASVNWTTSGTGSFTAGNTLSPVYEPSAGDIANGSVTLTLNVEAVAPCGNISDDMILTIQSQPVVDAGSDENICVDQSVTISTASASNYTTLTWTTSGDGIIIDGNTLTPTYTPGANDLANGQVTLTVEASATAPCLGSVNSSMLITFSEQVTANAGADDLVCEGSSYINTDAIATNEASVLWTTTGTGTFTNATLIQTTYLPSEADFLNGTVTLTLTAQAAAPCIGDASDDLVLTLVPEPNISAGDNGQICEGQTFTVSTATAANYDNIYWTTDGDGSFTGSTTITPVYTPGANDEANGTVTLTLNAEGAAPCAALVTDAITLVIESNPVVDAGSNATICLGESYTVNDASADSYASLTWISSGSGVILNPNSLNPTYTPSDADFIAGSVELTLTAQPNAPCAIPASDIMTIDFYTSPVVFAGDDGSICEDESFTINSSTAVNYSTVLWSTDGDGTFSANNTIHTIYTPGANDISNGTVNLTLDAFANAPCTYSVSDVTVLQIDGLPEAYAGADEDVCAAPFTITDATAANYSNISWTTTGSGLLSGANLLTPSYTPSPEDVANGSVVMIMTITGTGACTDQAQDSKMINFTTPVTVDAGSDQAICQDEELTINDASATNYSVVQWSTSGSGIFTDGNTLTPIYTPSLDDIAVGSVVLTITGTGVAPCGGTVSSDMLLTIQASPVAYAGADANIDAGDSYAITDAVASDYNSIFWETSGTGTFVDDNTISPTYTPSAADIAAGSVILTLHAEAVTPCDTDITDFIILTIGDVPTIDAGDDTEICENGIFTVSTSSASNYSTVTWTSSGSGLLTNANTLYPTYEPSADDVIAGSVVLTATVTALPPSTTTATDQMILTFHELPVVDAGPDVTICDTENLTIIASSASSYSSVTWTSSGTGNFANASSIHTIYLPSEDDLAAGSVTLTLTADAQNPCTGSSSDDLLLSFDPSVSVYAGVDAVVCAGGSVLINTATASDYENLSWTHNGTGTIIDNNTINPTYYPSANDELVGEVTLTLTGFGFAPCNNPEIDFMVVTITDAPEVSAGADTAICIGEDLHLVSATANNYSSVAWTSTGTGIFNNPTLLNPVYIPSANDILNGTVTLTMTVVGNAICPGVYVDQINVTINELPVADAGDNMSICQGENASITTASASNYSDILWTSDGSGVILNANSINPVYIPSNDDILDGTVILTLTATAMDPCSSSVSDQMLLTIGGGSVAFAGDDASICDGMNYTIPDAYAVNYTTYSWSHSGSGTLLNSATLTPTYVPDANDFISGTVTISLTAEGGVPCPAPITDNMILSLFENPVVNAGADADVCETDIYINTDASADNFALLEWTTSGSGSFTNPNVLNAVYQPSAADLALGNVILTLSADPINPCTSSVQDQLVINFGDAPTADAGADDFVCEGNNYSITDAAASNYNTLVWTTSGDGSFINGNLLTPTYVPGVNDIATGSVVFTLTVNGSAPCNDVVTDTKVLNINAHPDIYAGLDRTICENTSYTISDASATNYSAFLWTSSGTGTLENANTITPTYTPSSADVVAGNVVLTLTADDIAPCTGSITDELILTIQPELIVEAGADATICEIDTYLIPGASVANSSAYTWSSNGDGTFSNANIIDPVYTPGAADLLNGFVEITLTASPVSPCTNAGSDTFTLTIIEEVSVSAGPDEVACSSVAFAINGSSAENYSSITWITSGTGTFDDPSSVNPEYTASDADALAGAVTLTMTGMPLNPCAAASSDDMVLQVNSSPIVNAGVDASICEGQTYTLASATASNYNNLNWSTDGTGTFNNIGVENPVYTPSASDISGGSVTLTLTAIGNAPCTIPVTDVMQLSFVENPEVYAGADISVCESQFTINDATASDYSALLWVSSGTGVLLDETTINPTYIPSADDITNGSVILTISAASIAPCATVVNDQVIITLPAAPTVDAGADAEICNGLTFTTNANAGDYSALFWTTDGSGSFINGSTLTAEYIPSAADYAAGSVELTLHAVGLPPCDNVENSLTLSFIDAPTAFAGDDNTICEGEFFETLTASASNFSAVQWTSSGTGAWINQNSVDATYIPDATDVANGTVTLTMNVTGQGGCTSVVSDDVLVSIQRSALVDLGNDTVICNTNSYTSVNASVQYNASLLWTSNGDGSFTDETALLTSYIPGAMDIAAGTVTLQLTAQGIAPCSSSSDNIQIDLQAPSVVDAGADVEICAGPYTVNDANATNYDLVTWTSSGSGSLTDANTLTPTYTPDAIDLANGFFILTMEVDAADPCDNIITDNKTISIQQNAVVYAGSDIDTCAYGAISLNEATVLHADSVLWISSGTGSFINDHELNTSYSPSIGDEANGFVTLTLYAYGLPCGVVSDELTMNLSPTPYIETINDMSICDVEEVNINSVVAGNYASLAWTTFGDGSFDDATTLNTIYTPGAMDIANGSVVLRLQADGAGDCSDISESTQFTVLISQTPEVYAGMDTTICIASDYTISDAVINNYTALQWATSGDGTFDDTTIENPTYTPGAGDLASGIVTLTVQAENAPCTMESDVIILNVDPQPGIDAGVDATIDAGLSYQISTATANDVNSVMWSTSGSGSFDDPTSLNALYTPSAYDIIAGSVYLTITGFGPEQCGNVTDQMLLTIVEDGADFPLDFISEAACEDNPVHFYIDLNVTNTAEIASYHWDFGDGNTSTEMEPVHTYTESGVYTVVLTATNLTGDHALVSHNVDVNEPPHAFFNWVQPSCSGSEVQFIDESNVPDGHIVRWHWDFGDGTDTLIDYPNNPDITHVYALDMTYEVVLTVETSQSCYDNIVQQVVVTPSPIAMFSYADTCYNTTVSFNSEAVVNGGGNIVEWFWNFGDQASGGDNTAEGENVEHMFTAPGAYDIELIVVNEEGCSDTVVNTVNILEQPQVDFAWTSNCDEAVVAFTIDDMVTNIDEVVSWTWSFGDGTYSYEMEPGHVYPSNGAYFVELTIVNIFGCSNTMGHMINISEPPSAMFDVPDLTCHTDSVEFTYVPSSPSSPYVVRWNWDYGDGSTSTINWPDDPNQPHLYENPGSYMVTLEVINVDSCVNTYTEMITVEASPVANYSFENTCEDSEVLFTDLSQGNTAGMISHYEWNFGDPVSGDDNISYLQNPTHIFSFPGQYNVSLSIVSINGCTDVRDSLVVISPSPTVDYSYVTSCLEDVTTFNSSDFVDVDAIDTWLWDFGDGSTSSAVDPEHMFAESGLYTVSLTVTDTAGCFNSVSKNIEIITAPVAAFTQSSSACANTPIEFDDQSYAGEVISQWIWDMGDGTVITVDYPSQPDITYIYGDDGTYTVTLKVITESGCENEISNEVVVNILPDALAEADIACLGSPTQFTGDALINGGSEIWQWAWDFGDPMSGENNYSELQNPSHIYTQPGTYTAALVVTNVEGCSDTAFIELEINGIASFDFNYPEVTCIGQPSEFSIIQEGLDMAAVDHFEWEFGDGATIEGTDVEYTYDATGLYEVVVTLYDTAGCTVVASHELTVSDKPVVNATAGTACEFGATQFTDESYTNSGEPIIEWSWNFGDPDALPENNVSNEQNPVHYYTTTGTFTTWLTVTSASGCIDSTSIEVEVLQRPVANYVFDTTDCQQGLVYFTDQSISENNAIAEYEWMFEEGYYSDEQNPFYVFPVADTCYDVQLVVFDLNGCSDTLIQNVCIPKGFAPDFNHDIVCHGDTTHFDEFIISPVNDSIISMEWNFGDPASGAMNFSTASEPTHYYSEPGSYLVSLTATDENFCTATVYHTVYVNSIPEAGFEWENPQCDLDVYITDTTVVGGSDIATWTINWGDGSADEVITAPASPDVSHTYAADGEYIVTMEVVDINGCSDIFSDTVYRRPCIQSSFTYVTDNCSRTDVQFNDLSFLQDAIYEWTWNFGDGHVESYEDFVPVVTHQFDTAGVYHVVLEVKAEYEGTLLTSEFFQNIQIYDRPIAAIGAENVCNGNTTEFFDVSTPFGEDIVTWDWNFGEAGSTSNTATIENPTHKYNDYGEYNIGLRVTNAQGCTDTTNFEYEVYKRPEAKIEFENQACAGDMTYFLDATDTTDTGAEIVKWHWDFGDPDMSFDTANIQNPEYIYPDVRSRIVRLEVEDSHGCTSSTSRSVSVYEKPEASFIYETDIDNRQGNIAFINTTGGNIEYFEWDFSTGEPSVDPTPTVQLEYDGEYTFQLMVRHLNQCMDTMTVEYDHMFKTLFVPNAFSPTNPAEEVKYFRPVGKNLEEFRMQIFDLKGNILFETSKLDKYGSPEEGWDGKLRGIEMPQGIYVWKIFGVFKDGSTWDGLSVGNNIESAGKTEGTLILIR